MLRAAAATPGELLVRSIRQAGASLTLGVFLGAAATSGGASFGGALASSAEACAACSSRETWAPYSYL